MQTGKSRRRPVLLVGRAFWDKLINLQHLRDTSRSSQIWATSGSTVAPAWMSVVLVRRVMRVS